MTDSGGRVIGAVGWDADRDGVMEGCQHNMKDVEYYGSESAGTWYPDALRACAQWRTTSARPVPESHCAVAG